jgi:hypothetical protein
VGSRAAPRNCLVLSGINMDYFPCLEQASLQILVLARDYDIDEY